MSAITATVLVVLSIIGKSFAQLQPSIHRQCCEDYCFGTDSERPQTASYSTKTAYQIVRGVDSSRYYDIPNCRAEKFWMLSRHGTRLPSAKAMQKLKSLIDIRDQVIENYEQRKTKPDMGALCDADYQSLKNWRWDSNVTGDYNEFLTVQGWNDLKFMAKHYQRILPNVLENIYTPEKFLFRHTNTQRTKASYEAFVEGLFGDNAYSHIQLPPIPENDTLLKPYDSCPLWQKQNELNDLPTSESNKFIQSELYQEMLNEVSLRLGFRFQLTEKQVELIWDMCRFEQAWFIDRLSPWCAAFTKNHVSILEYKEDLKYYYKSGYGTKLNEKISCRAMSDMLKHMEVKNSGPQVVAYFTHSSAIQLFLTAMGVLRDSTELRADNFQQQQRRQWRTSKLGPFTANIAVIRYDCPEDIEKQKIMFFLNEKPLDIEWCRVGLCDYKDVLEKYSQYLNADCAQKYCGESAGNKVTISWVVLLCGALVYKFLF